MMTFNQWKNRKYVKEILGEVDPSPYESNITNVLGNRKVSNERIKSLAYWVVYDIDDDFLERFDALLSHPRTDSSSLKIHILRYGEEEGKRRFELKNTACAQTEKNMIERHGPDDGTKKWQEYKDNLSFSNSKEGYLYRYGVEKGTKLFNKQAARNAGNLTLERKQELFGDEFGLELYNEMTIKQSEKNTLKQYINSYGEEEGTKKYFEKNKVISYKNSLQYYIEQYGEEEGIKKCKTIKDNSSLEEFIKRYGEETGYKCYLDNNKKKAHTLENFIVRHGEEEGPKKYLKFTENILCGFSMIANELFDSLQSYSTLYGINEQIINLTEVEYNLLDKSYLMPDFICGCKIIEFNGDYWHGNIDVFPNDYIIPNINKLASEIRLRDKKRIEVLEKRGYMVKVVWENDFRKDREKVIKECKEFLDD